MTVTSDLENIFRNEYIDVIMNEVKDGKVHYVGKVENAYFELRVEIEQDAHYTFIGSAGDLLEFTTNAEIEIIENNAMLTSLELLMRVDNLENTLMMKRDLSNSETQTVEFTGSENGIFTYSGTYRNRPYTIKCSDSNRKFRKKEHASVLLTIPESVIAFV